MPLSVQAEPKKTRLEPANRPITRPDAAERAREKYYNYRKY